MHEYPITVNIIETASRFAREHGARGVSKIRLIIGDDSGYLADSIELYFGIIAENTACAGAALEIERVRPQLRCEVCGRLFERRPFEFACPDGNCPGEGAPTQIGREFIIKSIDVY